MHGINSAHWSVRASASCILYISDVAYSCLTSMKASSTSGACKATTGTSSNSPSTTSSNASTTTGGWLIPIAIPITSGSTTSGGGFTPSGFKPDTTPVSPAMSSTKSFPSMGSVNEPSALPPFSLSASASTAVPTSGIATSSSADGAPTAPSIPSRNKSSRSGSGNRANNNSNSPLSLELWVDPMKSGGPGSHGSYAQSSIGKDDAISKRAVGQTAGMASSTDASMSATTGTSSTKCVSRWLYQWRSNADTGHLSAALDRRALQSSVTTVTSTFTSIQVSTSAVAAISSDGKPVSTQFSASTSTGVFTTMFTTTFATPLIAPAPTTVVSSAFNANPAIGGIIGGRARWLDCPWSPRHFSPPHSGPQAPRCPNGLHVYERRRRDQEPIIRLRCNCTSRDLFPTPNDAVAEHGLRSGYFAWFSTANANVSAIHRRISFQQRNGDGRGGRNTRK
ncbi:hypothetical protein LXA43DRAFT_1054754 [Ganoderma leucocontextum]|nr:hypothetical protein LXA43DRAFT_1054754 [Ganoderma leucocontextum]